MPVGAAARDCVTMLAAGGREVARCARISLERPLQKLALCRVAQDLGLSGFFRGTPPRGFSNGSVFRQPRIAVSDPAAS